MSHHGGNGGDVDGIKHGRNNKTKHTENSRNFLFEFIHNARKMAIAFALRPAKRTEQNYKMHEHTVIDDKQSNGSLIGILSGEGNFLSMNSMSEWNFNFRFLSSRWKLKMCERP